MKVGIFAVCFALIALNSSAASFDCNKASTRVERTICGTADLSSLDDELATQYKKALEGNASIRQSQRDWLRETRNCETTNDIASCLRERYVARIATLKASNQQTIAVAPTRATEMVGSRISVLDGVWHSDEPKIGYTIKNGNAESLRDTFFGGKNIKKGEVLLWLKPVSANSFVGEQMFADGKFHPVTATLSNDDSLTFANAEHGISWTVKRKVESNQSSQATAPASSASNTGVTSKVNAEQQRMYDACANELMANYSPSQQKEARSRSNSTEAVGIQYICSQKVLQEQRRIDIQNRQTAESERIAKAMAEQRIMQQKAETERNARYAAEQEKSQQDKERKERQVAEQRGDELKRVAQLEASASERSSEKSTNPTPNQIRTPVVVDNKAPAQVRDNSGGSTNRSVSQARNQVRSSFLIGISVTILSTIIIIAIEFVIFILWQGKRFEVITANEIRVGTLEFRDPENGVTYADAILKLVNPSMSVPYGYSASHLQIGHRLIKNVHLPSEASYEVLRLNGLVSAVFTRRCSVLEYLINHDHCVEIRAENSDSAGLNILTFLICVSFLLIALIPVSVALKALGLDIYVDSTLFIASIFLQCCATIVILRFVNKRNRENLASLLEETKTLNPQVKTFG